MSTDGPHDALGHDRLADRLLAHASVLPSGAVIAVHGSWGRGKTDILRRISSAAGQLVPGQQRPSLWVNPWQYGTPDLITPLVAQLVERSRRDGAKGDRLRVVVRNLIRGANAIVFKSAAMLAPAGGGLIDRFGDIADDTINQLMDARSTDEVDIDPVATMAHRFAQLIEITLDGDPGPIVVCVDDIDRCLPSHQIAVLESLHFLTSTGADCVFFVAIDPRLVSEAAQTHYQTSSFNTERYLDKLFDIRYRLPGLSVDDVAAVVEGYLRQQAHPDAGVSVGDVMSDGFSTTEHDLVTAIVDAVYLPELRNPRVVSRVLSRLQIWSIQRPILDETVRFDDAATLQLATKWVAMTTRWPSVRELAQMAPEGFVGNVDVIMDRGYRGAKNDEHYQRNAIHAEIVLDNVPDSPDLRALLVDLFGDVERRGGDHSLNTIEDVAGTLLAIDTELIALGL